MTIQEALTRLDTDARRGLTEAEAAKRLKEFGPNQLQAAKRDPLIFLFFNQFKDLLIGLLILAAGLAYYLKDFHTTIILIVIVLLNALIGFYQEYSAERVLEALKKIIQSKATVIREAKRRVIDQKELVPGDLVYLEEGSAIPADLRLIETHFFSTNDFILTGESVSQEKQAGLIFDHETTVTNQDNLVFLGTTVARGNALAVVYGTGTETEVGRIAKTSESIERDLSTLQIEIGYAARSLTKIAGWIALALFGINFILVLRTGQSLQMAVNLSLLFAISIAASCVPQGLPTQITVALSLGVARLAKKNAVVKKLSAVETLGSTTVVCTDKTGTLTKNEMTITHCYANGRSFDVKGVGYAPEGEILENGKKVTLAQLESIKQFFEDGFLASNGRALPPDENHSDWYAVGDPTEAAFTPLAVKLGFDVDVLEKAFPVIQELPFDSDRKRMTIIREHKKKIIGYMKGGINSVLSCCTHINEGGTVRPLSEEEKIKIEALSDEYGARALRVIALAYRDFEKDLGKYTVDEHEKEFTFAGFVAMIDPPREGVKEAVEACYEAKIRIMMITGDNRVTAKAIAERIGMKGEGKKEMTSYTGDEIKGLNDFELRKILKARSVIFSRVSPDDKFRLVSILRDMGEVVAVTGDGVNDTLSLKKAHIGVAMGKAGSEVAKEASEIVLLDDNFSTLTHAIREGRTIYQNLKKTVLANIMANLGELTTVLIGFAGLAFSLPYPITAVQILAVDLIGELLPLTAITFDPGEKRIMQARPRKTEDHIVNKHSLISAIAYGMAIGAFAYLAFYAVHILGGGTHAQGQTAAYLTIVLAQLANIVGARSEESFFSAYTFTNPYLWGAIGLSLVFVALLTYVPMIALWFKFEGLNAVQWLWPMLGAFGMLVLHEIRKRGFKWTMG